MPAEAFTAIVVALHDPDAAEHLRRALPWVAAHVVLDPAELTVDAALPAGSIRVTTVATALGAVQTPWVLLLTDRDVVSPSLRAEITALPTRTSAPDGARVRFTQHGLAAALAPRARSIRIARSTGVRIALDRRLELGLVPAGASLIDLSARLERHLPHAIDDAAAQLERESRALGVLLDEAAVRPTMRHAAAAAVRAVWAARTAARAEGRRVDQTIAAGWAGYRAVLTYARLWERAYAAGKVG